MLQLITLKWNAPEIPTLEQVRKKLGLSIISIDEDFGIVVKDVQQRLFTILGDDKIVHNFNKNNSHCSISH